MSWQPVMQKHARSFYLASLFFPPRLFQQVKALYALCRWLDDAVDEAPNQAEALARLKTISQDLLSPEPRMDVNKHYRQQGLNPDYMKDLIQGVGRDRGPVRIGHWEELIQYCYQVAGTVGLAMYDLMGIPSSQARAHAVDLGLAMQITNICRDVKEDAERNRVYLPARLMAQHGLSQEALLSGQPESIEGLKKVVTHLLKQADLYYASSEQAFLSIPWRTRGAIIIAARLYRGIGVKLLRKGANPLVGRTYLTKPEKLWVLGGALTSWLLSGLKRNSHLTHNPQLHKGLESWKTARGFES